MARLIVKTADPDKQVIELKLGVNRVGRTNDNDFRIEHPTISSLHCELLWKDEKVFVRDCGSTNGVFINDEPVKEGQLQPGQILRLGDVELFVESTIAHIHVPEVFFERSAPPVPLADGSLPCAKHPAVKAAYHCTHCGGFYCVRCIHRLRVSGGKRTLRLCPDCSGHVEVFDDGKKRKRRSLFDLLTDTLRLPFHRNSSRRPEE